VFGIAIEIHWTFFVLLGWVALLHGLQGGSWRSALAGVGLILGAFGSVELHELGHALAARSFGIGTREITLYPMGGVARLERMPEVAWQELVVALAGPLVNLLLAAVLFGVAYAVHGPLHDWMPSVKAGLVVNLVALNLVQCAFNLLPAFPMDGGRVLRALLALVLDRVRATHIAARIGQGFALLFALLGLLSNPMLLLVALFVWLGAEQEARMVEIQADLVGLRAADVALRSFYTISPDASLRQAADAVLAGQDALFVVDAQGAPLGVLSRRHLLQAAAQGRLDGPVAQAMVPATVVLDEQAPLSEALSQLSAAEVPVMPVVRDGRLTGVLSLDFLGDWLLLHRARRAA
jgi:Zn-dependent protease/CBS domain-containing protein